MDMSYENIPSCDRLKDLLKAERKIIVRHLDRHKWFRGIKDANEGVKDFIENYGWIMRELYCENVCDKAGNCDTYKMIVIQDNKASIRGV